MLNLKILIPLLPFVNTSQDDGGGVQLRVENLLAQLHLLILSSKCSRPSDVFLPIFLKSLTPAIPFPLSLSLLYLHTLVSFYTDEPMSPKKESHRRCNLSIVTLQEIQRQRKRQTIKLHRTLPTIGFLVSRHVHSFDDQALKVNQMLVDAIY